jgi:UDP-2-acetamido-3-amino-2,3-dideoxy-glucuronate N-acetyltransferase
VGRHGLRLPAPGDDGRRVCPASGLRYEETGPGLLRCIDLDEEAALPRSSVEGGRP